MSKTTRSTVKSSVTGGGGKDSEAANANQAKLAQDEANRVSPSETTTGAAPGVPSEVAVELAKLSALIIEKSESHDKKLEEIRNTTHATERKIADIATRISEVEEQLCFLEDAHQKQVVNPLASSTEVEILREKVDDMENRERRNNLRFLGFAESCEGNDIVVFLQATLSSILNVDFPGGLDVERAHPIGSIASRTGQTALPYKTYHRPIWEISRP